MVKIITSVTPSKKRSSKLQSELETVVWDIHDGHAVPQTHVLERPHQIPTKRIRHTALDALEAHVQNYRDAVRVDNSKEKQELVEHALKTIALEGPFPSSVNPVFVLTTPFVDKPVQLRHLSDDFLCGSPYNSISWMARTQLQYPYGILEDDNTVARRASLKLLRRRLAYALDIETKNYMNIRIQPRSRAELLTDYARLIGTPPDLPDRQLVRAIESVLDKQRGEEVTTVSLMNPYRRKNYLITTLESGMAELEAPIPGSQENLRVSIITVASQAELVKRLNELYKHLEPFTIYGHNILTFDYRKLKELTGAFEPGIDRTEPQFVAKIAGGFIEQHISKGRTDMDSKGIMQNYGWFYSNRLDVIFEQVMGFRSLKDMNHAELEAMTQRAVAGDREAARQVLYYTAQDSIKTFQMGEKLAPVQFLIAMLQGTSTASVATTSSNTLSKHHWARRMWQEQHTLPVKDPGRHLIRGKVFDQFSTNDYLEKRFRFHARQGAQEGTLVAVFPTVVGMKDLLFRDATTKNVYRSATRRPPLEQALLMRALRSVAEYPFAFLYENIMSEREALQAHLHELSAIGKQIDHELVKRTFEDAQRSGSYAIVNDAAGCDVISRIHQFLKGPTFYQEFMAHQYELHAHLSDAFMSIDDMLEAHKPINSYGEFFLLESPPPAREGIVVLGTGSVLSGDKGRFAYCIDGRLNMMGIADPKSNKGERCPYEKVFYQRFIDTLLREGKEQARDYAAQHMGRFATAAPEELLFAREARRTFTDFSDNVTAPHAKIMRERRTLKGENISYSLPDHEMREKLFGAHGTIYTLLSWAFPSHEVEALMNLSHPKLTLV